MKIKNLNFLEKHIEKIVIALGVLFFLVVMWLFVLGQPYTVEITTRSGVQTVTPDKVEDLIETEARRLETAINRPNPPFDEIPLPSWTADFRNRMTGRFLPVDILPTPMHQPGLDKALVDIGPGEINPPRYLPTPPAPQDIKAHADYGVLAVNPNQQMAQQLVQLIGNTGVPRDFRYVSVAAQFPLEAWRERLKAEPTGTEQQRIPEDWWRNRLFITDVQLQRQEMDPATGQWSQPVTIPNLPTQTVSFRGQDTPLTAAEIPPLIQSIRESQDRITQPAFVDMTRGVWMPPGAQTELSPEQSQKLNELQQRIATLQRRIAGSTATPAAPFDPAQSGATGNLQQEIADLEAQRNEILGIAKPQSQEAMQNPAASSSGQFDRRDPSGRRPMLQDRRDTRRPGGPGSPGAFDRREPFQTGPFAQPGQTGQPGQPAVIPTLPDITLWAHDLTVEPGKTYRYRLLVSVISPLFHINDVPREQYREYFNRLSLTSEPSEWTGPVKVDPEIYFFLTGHDAARRTATVDVMRIFNGIWVRQGFDVRPGDTIGGMVEMPLGTETIPVDLKTDAMAVDLYFPAPSTLGGSVDNNQTRLLVYDMASKRMVGRTLGQDTQNETFQRLLREIQLRSALASSQ